MKTKLSALLSLFFALCPYLLIAKTIYDHDNSNIHSLVESGKAKYVIRYNHFFNDTLYVPSDSEFLFEGGHLSGPIVFDNTKLSGNVNLKGSSIGGTLRNKKFNASWLCVTDGTSDNAPQINEIIKICNTVFFPKGTYRLVSQYNANGEIPKELIPSIKSHIGINKDNVSLIGESGTVLITDEPLGTICIFSQPNDIERSVRNILIKNITFDVHNDGKNFYEFMHTIKLIGVNIINIENCTFNDFWGDAICLSHYGDTPRTGERTRNQDVRIINNTIIGGKHHSNRNGISIVSGKDVLVKNNYIKNTSRNDMPGGIDVEPNNSAYTIENIKIENNVLEGIQGSGGAICVVIFNEGPAHGISIVGNRIVKSRNGLLLYVKTDDTSDNFIIKDNIIDENTHPLRFTGNGETRNWTICGNVFKHPIKQKIPGDIKVTNLLVKNNKKKG